MYYAIMHLEFRNGWAVLENGLTEYSLEELRLQPISHYHPILLIKLFGIALSMLKEELEIHVTCLTIDRAFEQAAKFHYYPARAARAG